MGLNVDLQEMLGRHPGVNLGGADPSVAEHLLDSAQIGPAFHHVGGGAVAQHMR